LNLGEKPGSRPVFPRACSKLTGFWNKLNYNEISELCHKYAELVFITKNGTGDLAVMSIETYKLLTGKLELYSLANEGPEQAKK
jgi:PHD/YefM family antitoxin component YafN of YafNO toxin-antitoxin module